MRYIRIAPIAMWRVLPALVAIGMSLLLLLGVTHIKQAKAATSSTVNFQARLMAANGAIVPDGTYNVEFKIYDAASSSGSSQGSCTGDSACKWTETRVGGDKVTVTNGYLTVSLGSVTALPGLNWDQELWLTMNIGGTGAPGWDGEMSPRLKLTAVPYALFAGQLAATNGSFRSTLSFIQPTASHAIQLPDESGTLCIQSSTACGFALSSGSTSYIQNQNSSDQTANFRITGTGRAGTALQAPLLDTAAAGTLSLGTTNATAIALDKATTVTGNLAQSGGTVALAATGAASLTGTGALTLTGGAASTFTTTSGGIIIQAFNTNVLTLNTSGAGTVSLGNTNSTTISIGRGSDIARTINIGNAGSSTTQTISIGSLNGSSSTTIQGGTGASAINLTTGSGGSVNITTSGAGNINLNSAASTIAKSTTNNSTAFQVQNASGGYVLNVDTASNIIGLAYLNVGTSGASDATVDTAFAAALFIGTTNATAITIGNNSSDVSINCGTSTCNFGTNATAHTTTIGSTTGAAGVTIQGGTGAIAIGTNAIAHAVTVGTLTGAAATTIQGGTGGVNLGTGGIANTVQIGNITGAVSQTTNIGTNATASSTNNVNIGSSVAGTVAIAGPTTITNRTSGSVETIIVSNSTSTAPIAKFRDDSTTILNLADGGAATFSNQTNSTTGFQVQNSGSTPQFVIDTTNSRVYIGNPSSDTTGALLVLDTKSDSGDPTSVSGAIYYSSARGTMRCNQGGFGWTDCLGVPKPNTRRWAYLTMNGGTAGTEFTDRIGEDSTTGGAGTFSTSLVAPTTSDPPMLHLQTGATSGNDVNESGDFYFNTSANPLYQAYVKYTDITSVRTWVGWTGISAATLADNANPSGDYAMFRFDTGQSDSTLKCVTHTGSSSQVTDSGITPATSTARRLEINIISGTSVIFKVDGNVVCTNTTTLPASSTLVAHAEVVNTLTGSAATMDLGWVYIESDR